MDGIDLYSNFGMVSLAGASPTPRSAPRMSAPPMSAPKLCLCCSIREVTLRYILLQQVSEISHIFKTSDDIPLVIAPTENDWQVPPNKNHVLLWGLDSDAKQKEYTMIVTSENSHQLEERVSIQIPDDEGKVLQFSEPAKGSAFHAK